MDVYGRRASEAGGVVVPVIRFQAETLDRLRAHLQAAAPEETGTFALVGSIRRGDPEADITVRELVLPVEGDWSDAGEDHLTPTTSYINRATVAAESLGLGVAFVHSHPSPLHPAGLSWIDEVSTRKLFNNIGKILGQVPLASMVFTPQSFSGVAQVGDSPATSREIVSIRVVGNNLSTLYAEDRAPPPSELEASPQHDRQVLALGGTGQRVLAALKVGIVGAGGTGSCIGEELARMGIRQFVLVDDDRLELSNVSRVYGSTRNAARRRKRKVDVLAGHIRRINPDARPTAISAQVAEPSALESLSSCDVVFGCTDTHGSRGTLNDLAYKCLIPVIDVGCRIDAPGGVVRGELGRIRYLRPGLPCLWCTGTIDGTRVLQESMSKEERARLAASGYGSGIGPEPSVIHLTSVMASLAVGEFLSIVAGRPPTPDGTWLSVDLTEPYLTRVRSRVEDGCRCLKVMGLGAAGHPASRLWAASP